MTLIIAALTERYVALVSDRRVTVTRGGKLETQEDTDTKSFNLCGQFLMGFTGIARIGGLRMERWVLDAVKGRKCEDYFAVIAERMTQAFDMHGYTGRQPHAFLAAGYAFDSHGSRYVPSFATISNFMVRGDDSPTASSLTRDFHVRTRPLGNQRQQILSVGWSMPTSVSRSLTRQLRIAAKGIQSSSNPLYAVRPMVHALRTTADESNGAVGHSAIFSSLPKCAVPDTSVALGEVDMTRECVSLYLPKDVKHPRQATTYAMGTISPGISIVGIQIGDRALGPPDEGYL